MTQPITPCLEHVNLTVHNIDHTVRFLQTALPHWQVRGEGTMDWFGKPIRWLHIGTDAQYLALQGGGEGDDLEWQSHHVGAKHVGFVVASVDEVVARLSAAGHALDHWGAQSASRRNVYFIGTGSVQFEFVEYTARTATERNDYPAPATRSKR